ncbi:MAG: hypothetical protein P8074_12130 [Anaerolineales bacterium]|jgi:hypothetical protein
METKSPPSVIKFIPSTVILMVLGWGGFIAVTTYTSPSGGTRWAFFFTSVLAITGTVLPLIALLNRRFPSRPAPTPSVVLRQALWVGVYIPTLAWLQIGRVLTPALALLLAVGFVLIEWLMRMRERAQWKP